MAGTQVSTLTLRQPPNSTEPPSGIEVKLKHPGYSDRKNTLVSLVGLDTDGERVGLHFGTAVTICAILSGRKDGFFTNGVDDPRLDLSDDNLLDREVYYYHVPNDPQYPIYPSFEHWPFPHDDLLPSYNRAAPRVLTQINATGATQAVLNRDERCLVSGSRDKQILQRAHLCPKGSSSWFIQNDMSEYNQFPYLTGDLITNDVANAIALRQDIHQAFDSRLFAFVEKRGVWATHFLKPTFELGRDYHNTQVAISAGVSAQFLYARLAWSIFPLVRPFLQSSMPRWIYVRVSQGEWRRQELGMTQINAKIFPSRSGSESPTKRSRSGASGPGDNGDAYCNNKRGWSTACLEDKADDEDTARHQDKSWRNRHIYKPRDLYSNSIQQPISPLNSRSLSPTKANDNSFEHPPSCSDNGSNASSIPDTRLSWKMEDLERYVHSEEYAATESLRKREILLRRPRYDSALFCCNYDEHDEEERALLNGLIDDGDCKYRLCLDCDRCGDDLPMGRGDFQGDGDISRVDWDTLRKDKGAMGCIHKIREIL